MTMTMSETFARSQGAHPPPHDPRPRAHSLSQMPTETITLSPELIAALRAIAPRGRRRALPILLSLIALAVVVWMATPSSARGAVLAGAGRLLRRAPTVVADPPEAPAVPSSPAAAPPTAPPAMVAAVATPTASPAKAASPTKPQKKTSRKGGAR